MQLVLAHLGGGDSVCAVRDGRDICAGLGLIGVARPSAGDRDDDGPVSPPGATVPVLVVQPREEIQLALDMCGLPSW